jgi:hypothetical protein
MGSYVHFINRDSVSRMMNFLDGHEKMVSGQVVRIRLRLHRIEWDGHNRVIGFANQKTFGVNLIEVIPCLRISIEEASEPRMDGSFTLRWYNVKERRDFPRGMLQMC